MPRICIPNARVPPAYGEAPAGRAETVDEGRGKDRRPGLCDCAARGRRRDHLGDYSVGKYSFTAWSAAQ